MQFESKSFCQNCMSEPMLELVSEANFDFLKLLTRGEMP